MFLKQASRNKFSKAEAQSLTSDVYCNALQQWGQNKSVIKTDFPQRGQNPADFVLRALRRVASIDSISSSVIRSDLFDVSLLHPSA